MRLILAFLVCLSSTAFGQLYSSYSTEGVMNSTGGPIRGKSELLLTNDSCFTMIQKSYSYQNNNSKKLFLVDSSASFGRWSLDGETLRLDFHPDIVRTDKKFDTYLVRKKGLTRTTLKEFGVKAKYKASGPLLDF